MAQWRCPVCHLRYQGDLGWDVILVLFRVGIEIDHDCECSNYHTIALTSHTKVMLKILQVRFQKYVNRELPDVQAGFRKGRETRETKLPTSTGSSKKQGNSKINIYFCFIDYAKAFDCVDHNTLWKTLKEMRIPDHFTCVLRNPCAGQEATVRTKHETID